MQIPSNRDITYFAKTNYRDTQKMFGIKRRDRRQHMYVLGKSGTGKSAMIKNMVIQNIANGEGVAVVDPHGELVEEILEMIPPERKNDVVYFNPSDTDYFMGFNVLEVPDPKYMHLIASGLMGIFTKIWANVWSARMEYILNNAILALLETPGSTMLGIPRLLVDQDYRQAIINNVKDPVVKAFWITEYETWNEKFRNEAIAPIQNKVGQFLSSAITRNIVGQAKSTVDIFDIMNNKKILLVNVSKGRVGEDNSALLGAMIITKIQLAAMERVRIPEEERKDFYLYVDEFQNFVTDSFASILSEARKYRLNLVLAHQYINQLIADDSTMVRDAVFGNVGTMVVFRVGAADAEFIEKEFEPEFTPQDFVNLPNYHIYTKLMIDGVTSRPFSATTLPPFQVATSHSTATDIIEHSRVLYARPRDEVEREISEWSNTRPGIEDVPTPEEAAANENLQPGADGLYRVRCSLFEECTNVAKVPFKPEKGRPVYCKDHIKKLQNGEIEPQEQKNDSNEKKVPEKEEKQPIPEKIDERTKYKPKNKIKPTEQQRKTLPTQKANPKTGTQDKLSLKSLLAEALGEQKEKESNEIIDTSSNQKNTITEEKKEEISLRDLVQKKPVDEIDLAKKETAKLPREASPGSVNSLKEALNLATQEQEDTLKKQNEILEKTKQEAMEKAEEFQRELEEERKKREATERETVQQADQLLEKQKAASSTAPKKEVPEDILRSVLE